MDDQNEEDDQSPDEIIVTKTADLLEAAGEVIHELRRREGEKGESYDCGDLLERVQVAQVLVLVASGERALKSHKDHEEFMKGLEAKREESNKRTDELLKKVGLRPKPEVPPVPPRAEAVPLPEPMPVPLPPLPPPRNPDEEELLLGVHRTKEGWTVDVFFDNDFQLIECATPERLATTLTELIPRLMKKEKEK